MFVCLFYNQNVNLAVHPCRVMVSSTPTETPASAETAQEKQVELICQSEES